MVGFVIYCVLIRSKVYTYSTIRNDELIKDMTAFNDFDETIAFTDWQAFFLNKNYILVHVSKIASINACL